MIFVILLLVALLAEIEHLQGACSFHFPIVRDEHITELLKCRRNMNCVRQCGSVSGFGGGCFI